MRDSDSTPDWQSDGAGSIARIGVLRPDFDPVPESELWAWLRPAYPFTHPAYPITTTRDHLPSRQMSTLPRNGSLALHRT
jgi:hypothetical protein